MIQSDYRGLKISGIACCVPENKKRTEEYSDRFGADKVEKFIKMTGVVEKHDSVEKQTASDLAFVAARELLKQKNIDPESIGALIFVTGTPDYQIPSTAFVLQYRLGISKDSLCFDVNLSCSGFLSGLNILASIMASANIKRGLLLFGDTMTKKLSPEDRSIVMMIGDAGGAVLLDKDDTTKDEIHASSLSEGSKYKLVYIPAGANRHPVMNSTRIEAEDGNIRGPYDFYMDGANVFFYFTSDAVKFMKKYLETNNKTEADYDALVLHQANEYILKTFAKRIGFSMNKVPISIDRFGNTVGSSIPITIVDSYAGGQGSLHLLSCGVGVGLSVALLDFSIDKSVLLPLIYSDEYFEDDKC